MKIRVTEGGLSVIIQAGSRQRLERCYPGHGSHTRASYLKYCLEFKSSLGGFVVLQLQLMLSTIPMFCNPAVTEFFEGFNSSLATPFLE